MRNMSRTVYESTDQSSVLSGFSWYWLLATAAAVGLFLTTLMIPSSASADCSGSATGVPDSVLDLAIGEQCDDGNMVAGTVDGCNNDCTIQTGWACNRVCATYYATVQPAVDQPRAGAQQCEGVYYNDPAHVPSYYSVDPIVLMPSTEAPVLLTTTECTNNLYVNPLPTVDCSGEVVGWRGGASYGSRDYRDYKLDGVTRADSAGTLMFTPEFVVDEKGVIHFDDDQVSLNSIKWTRPDTTLPSTDPNFLPVAPGTLQGEITTAVTLEEFQQVTYRLSGNPGAPISLIMREVDGRDDWTTIQVLDSLDNTGTNFDLLAEVANFSKHQLNPTGGNGQTFPVPTFNIPASGVFYVRLNIFDAFLKVGIFWPQACITPVCGDGLITGTEQCDDRGMGDDCVDAGLPNECTFIDTDGDGIPDRDDVDDDNDGIPDWDQPPSSGIEVGESGTSDPSADTDNDGIPDWNDAVDTVNPAPPAAGCVDAAPVDGACDLGTLPTSLDADGDGLPNHLDPDSDNDGVFDIIEAGGTDGDPVPGDGQVDYPTPGVPTSLNDANNGNGWDDNYDPNVTGSSGGAPLEPPDDQSDGSYDFLDPCILNDGTIGVPSTSAGCIDTFRLEALSCRVTTLIRHLLDCLLLEERSGAVPPSTLVGQCRFEHGSVMGGHCVLDGKMAS